MTILVRNYILSYVLCVIFLILVSLFSPYVYSGSCTITSKAKINVFWKIFFTPDLLLLLKSPLLRLFIICLSINNRIKIAKKILHTWPLLARIRYVFMSISFEMQNVLEMHCAFLKRFNTCNFSIYLRIWIFKYRY